MTGPGGLLGDLTKRVLEAGLEGEMDGRLGYAKHTVEGRDGGNSRNGTRSKTVITDSVRRNQTFGRQRVLIICSANSIESFVLGTDSVSHSGVRAITRVLF